MEFSIQTVFTPPRAQACLRGEFDVMSWDALRLLFMEADRLGCHYILVEAEAVSFIDCAAVRTIAEAQERLRQAGGQLAVMCASTRFRRVCELGGYQELIGCVMPAQTAQGLRKPVHRSAFN